MSVQPLQSQGLQGLIYDAALDAGRWVGVLDSLRDAFDAVSSVLVLTDPLRRDVNLAVASGVMADPRLQDEYQRRWADRDPALAHFARTPAGAITTTSRLWSDPQDRAAFAFHREFYAPNGLSDSMVVSLEQGGGRLGLLALTRGTSQPDFSEGDIERLLALTPHLQRSLQLHDQLAGQVQRGGPLSAAAELMASGLLVLDHAGAVLAANAAARRIARRDDGVSLANDRLGFPEDPAAAALCRRYLAGVLGGGEHAAGGQFLVRRTGGQSIPYGLTLAPLPPIAGALASGARQGVMVVVTEPKAPSSRTVGVIATHFRLTPSEEALLVAMVEGRSLAEHAAAREISANAARFHAKAIFAKTQTRGQPELVRLVLMMSASLGALT